MGSRVRWTRSRGVQLAATSVIAILTREFATKAVRLHNSRLDMGRLEQVLAINLPHWRAALDQELDDLGRSGATCG